MKFYSKLVKITDREVEAIISQFNSEYIFDEYAIATGKEHDLFVMAEELSELGTELLNPTPDSLSIMEELIDLDICKSVYLHFIQIHNERDIDALSSNVKIMARNDLLSVIFKCIKLCSKIYRNDSTTDTDECSTELMINVTAIIDYVYNYYIQANKKMMESTNDSDYSFFLKLKAVKYDRVYKRLQNIKAQSQKQGDLPNN